MGRASLLDLYWSGSAALAVNGYQILTDNGALNMMIETKKIIGRYSRHCCCVDRTCRAFKTMLDVSECYTKDGSVVRACSDCK